MHAMADGAPHDMTYSEIWATSVGDNAISSIQVPQDWELEMWQHDFAGYSRTFTGDE